MEENMQMICNSLCATLQLTNRMSDMVSLIYENNGRKQFVIARFSGGNTSNINVNMDDGSSMIRDILRCIR